MKQFMYFIILLIAAVLLSSCIHTRKPITEDVVEIDTVEQYDYVPTVYDILQEREEMRYSRWVDSVYVNIPEQIITHMLVTKGTTMSIFEIVEDYWVNKQFYHDTILNSMNIQKKYIPDSLPTKPKPDTPILYKL